MLIGGRMVMGIFMGFGETEILGLSYRFLVTHGLLCFVLALLFICRFSLQGWGTRLCRPWRD